MKQSILLIAAVLGYFQVVCPSAFGQATSSSAKHPESSRILTVPIGTATGVGEKTKKSDRLS